MGTFATKGSYFAMLHFQREAEKLKNERDLYFKTLVKIRNGVPDPKILASRAIFALPPKVHTKGRKVSKDPNQLRML